MRGAALGAFARRWVPLAVRQRLVDWGPYGYCGHYADWAAARDRSIGYDATNILEKTREATTAVRDGRTAYEQDGVLLDEVPDHAYRLGFLLATAALEQQRDLGVIDFGGALGGTYFGCRRLLPARCGLRWVVVEQDLYCDCGRREFADANLSFCRDLAGATAPGPPDVIVCSSVLQFLEDPQAVLRQLLDLGPSYLIVDRTPFTTRAHAEITVQRVPSTIYRASYPSWLLSERECLASAADRGFDVGWRWHLPSAFTARATFKGFVLRPARTPAIAR